MWKIIEFIVSVAGLFIVVVAALLFFVAVFLPHGLP